MRKLLIATAATALSMWASSASASAIYYDILVNGSSIQSGSSANGVLTAIEASGGGFTIILNAVGAPAQTAPNLSTNTFNINSNGNAGTIEIQVSNTGLSSPSVTTQNTFTTNSLDGSGFISDTITNYFDQNNNQYSSAPGANNGTVMASMSYNGLGSFSTGPIDYTLSPTGTFSESTVYDLNFSAGNANSTVTASSQIVATTPEPNSLVLLGTGLIGAAGMLFMRRRQAENLL